MGRSREGAAFFADLKGILHRRNSCIERHIDGSLCDGFGAQGI